MYVIIFNIIALIAMIIALIENIKALRDIDKLSDSRSSRRFDA